MCELLLLNIKKLILYNVLTDYTCMQRNWNPKFQIYSIIENLKQKYFNSSMLDESKRSSAKGH